jgi:hypothetical protein
MLADLPIAANAKTGSLQRKEPPLWV